MECRDEAGTVRFNVLKFLEFVFHLLDSKKKGPMGLMRRMSLSAHGMFCSAYSLMSFAVLLHKFLAIVQFLLDDWVDEQFFGMQVPGKLPRKLVLPDGLFVRVDEADDLFVARLKLSVVVLNGVGNGAHCCQHTGA